MDKQLSIIVPVYNAEKYIRTCLESILRQGLSDEDYELIVVNDGTPDKSMECISDLLTAHNNTIVIEQENKGSSVARNAGLSKSTGEYILFVDSDDLLIDGRLKLVLQKALETQTDILTADYLKKNNNEISTIQESPFQQNIQWEFLTGREMFFKEARVTVWNRLFRRRFLQDQQIEFFPGIYNEDILFTYECYLKSEKCVRTNCLLNIYRQHDASITSLKSIKRVQDTAIVIGRLFQFKNEIELSPKELKHLQSITLKHLFEMFEYTESNIDGIINQLQALRCLSQYAPALSFTDGLFQKIITVLYRISPRLLMIVWKLRKKR